MMWFNAVQSGFPHVRDFALRALRFAILPLIPNPSPALRALRFAILPLIPNPSPGGRREIDRKRLISTNYAPAT